jgi:hypothetical protein
MRSPALWLVLIGVLSAGIGATYVTCPGCVDRSRVNSVCEWTGDAAFPLDLQNPAHRQHLVADAQLAEELAIRRADAEHQRLYGSYGHGGLIDHGRLRNECMAQLVTRIERDHGVTPGQVALAREQRDWRFDLAVVLLFLPCFCFGATTVYLALRRRFSSTGYVELVATLLTGVVVSLLGLGAGQLWSAVWETIRVGNGHMSLFRSASYTVWTEHHAGALFICGVLLFWLIAYLSHRLASDDELSGRRSMLCPG